MSNTVSGSLTVDLKGKILENKLEVKRDEAEDIAVKVYDIMSDVELINSKSNNNPIFQNLVKVNICIDDDQIIGIAAGDNQIKAFFDKNY